MTPAPICLTVFLSKPGEIPVFAMILFQPNSIGSIFVVIPMVIVVVSRS